MVKWDLKLISARFCALTVSVKYLGGEKKMKTKMMKFVYSTVLLCRGEKNNPDCTLENLLQLIDRNLMLIDHKIIGAGRGPLEIT